MKSKAVTSSSSHDESKCGLLTISSIFLSLKSIFLSVAIGRIWKVAFEMCDYDPNANTLGSILLLSFTTLEMSIYTGCVRNGKSLPKPERQD